MNLSASRSLCGPFNIKERQIFRYTLVKLAMRCNLDCTYCYWFRDKGVYERPSLLTQAAENAYLAKLQRHIQRYGLKSFYILFHGGEPLLFGKQRFDEFCTKLRVLEKATNIELRLGLTTNGVLVDRDWAHIFSEHCVGVTLSIDGPKHIHDAARLDFKGHGTFDQAIRAFHTLRNEGVEPGVLGVCNPNSDPADVYKFFVYELGLKAFDILIPDANHDSSPRSVSVYYRALFDLWYSRYESDEVRIRLFESITKGLLGEDSNSESIGYGPTATATLLTDGSLEPLDVLRTAGYKFTKTAINIFDHELQDIDQDPLWREVLEASLNLNSTCTSCQYKIACGGGHIGSRWSRRNRFDNPSVYCADLKDILAHAWDRIGNDAYLKTPNGELSLNEALSSSWVK